MQQSAGKVMASVFWDAYGIISIDYVEKGKYINSDHYIELLVRLKDEIAKKRPHMKKKKIIFHQDNAPYSPDLAPSDYWLFYDLKKMPQG